MNGDGSWELREMPVPEDPPVDGAILRVEATGVCHSDVDHMHGIVHTPWGGAYPSIPGHEVVGRIDTLTDAAKAAWGVDEGDRVAVRAAVPIGDGNIRVYGHDFGISERSGLFGGFADYMELLPTSEIRKLPDDIPAEELTIWEPLSIAAGWAGPITAGDSVAILGPGHLGLATIVAARAAGAEQVFITGTAADGVRLEAARRLGVDEAIDVTTTDPIERIRELSDGGVNVVIDAASATTVTVVQAMQMVRRFGTVVIGGLKDRKPVDGFISDWIPMKKITMMAGTVGDHVGTAVDLLWQGKVPTAELVGEVFTLDDVDEALGLVERTIAGRDAIRVGLRLQPAP